MIRIVHTLGGCGGTLLSRCLGVLPRIALLSEINPLAVHLFPNFNPLYQDEQWLHLLSDDDRTRLSKVDLGQTASFCDMIRTFYSRSKLANRTLILRDYNYVDFVGIPFIDRPPRRRIIYDALPHGEPTTGVAFVRHPIDQWVSLCKHAVLRSVLRPAEFCDAYAAFLSDLGDTPVFRYEDFVHNPENELQRICGRLEVPFDPAFKDRFHTFSFVTGDFSRADNTISMPRRAPLPDDTVKEFRSSTSFYQLLKTLGYTTEQYGLVPSSRL